MKPQFSSLEDGTGLEILDPIEGVRVVIRTPEDVTPVESDPDAFAQPVSTACRIRTSGLEMNGDCSVTLHDTSDGSILDAFTHLTDRTLRPDVYLLGIATRIRIYVRVHSGLIVDANANRVRFDFRNSTELSVGARSLHREPAGTITVPDEPRELMEAVSTFGSGLKTLSADRSWPTLRGHPPRIERGDELDIPDEISSPETGVSIHVPPDYDHVYPVVSLACYLGATVVPGDPPRLTTDSGFAHRLDTDRGFDSEVARVLRQMFLFDCVARGHGSFYMNLHERQTIEARSTIDIDFESTFEEPISEQLPRYLSVPYTTVEDVVPDWNRVTYVRPNPKHAPLLPYLANELSLVRTELPVEPTTPTPGRRRNESAIAAFKRDSGPQSAEQFTEDDRRKCPSKRHQYVPLPEDAAAEVAWAGDETPEHGSKLLVEAFERERPNLDDVSIDVTVVCNDEEMREEHDSVVERYGIHEMVQFNVERYENLSSTELRDLFVDDTDLLHYIGHIDGDGFECSDGRFDAQTLDETGATIVLLNACRSYNQGISLVEAGASAAVVSLGDVENVGAVEVGEKFAGLLNFGFPVGTALEIVSEVTSIGRQYIALGNPSASVAQCVNDAPHLLHGVSLGDGEIDAALRSYASNSKQVGTASRVNLVPDETYYLIPSTYDLGTLDRSVLNERAEEGTPIVLDGELTWLDEDTL